MPPRPTTRLTTEAERALVARVLRGQRAVFASIVGLLTAAGLVVLVLATMEPLTGGESTAAFGAAAVVWGFAVAVWAVYRKVRSVPVDPGVAVAIDGELDVGPPHVGGDGPHRLSIEGREVTVPQHWHSYLSPGARHTAWVVETGRTPLVVAVERGPSADADVDGPGGGPRPGALVTVFALWLQALLVAGWTAASGRPSWPVVAVSVALAAGGVVVAAGLVQRRDRLHAAYHAAGVRFALPLRVRQARRRRRTAWIAGFYALGSAVGAHLLLGYTSAPALLCLAVVAGLFGWFHVIAAGDGLPTDARPTDPAT